MGTVLVGMVMYVVRLYSSMNRSPSTIATLSNILAIQDRRYLTTFALLDNLFQNIRRIAVVVSGK